MKKLIGLAMFACVAVLAGCVSAPVPPMDTRVTVAPNIGCAVYVTDVRCAKTAGSDYLTLQANVVNNTASERRVQWKVQWLDADGIEIESLVSGWNAVALQAFEIKGLRAVAPRTDAADMRIYLKAMEQ